MRRVHAGSALVAGLALTDLNVRDLWFRYFALGGSHTQDELGAYLRGEVEWNPNEHDVAAHAINEDTNDHGLDHPVGYSDEI